MRGRGESQGELVMDRYHQCNHHGKNQHKAACGLPIEPVKEPLEHA
jgi:hypothetical protein